MTRTIPKAWHGILIGALVAGLSAPAAWAVAGGGTIENSPPGVLDFSHMLTNADAGEEDIFFGTFLDVNGEQDFVLVHLFEETDQITKSVRSITDEDRSRLEEPDFDEIGWKVWDPTPGDGMLRFAYRLVYPETATIYRFSMGASDETWVTDAAFIDVRVYRPLHVEPDPVDFQGNSLPGSRWGGWHAHAGHIFVRPENVLKIVNGKDPQARVLVDFTAAAFNGQRHTIPIDGNIRFRSWQTGAADATPMDGAVALDFSDAGQVLPEELAQEGSAELAFTGAGYIMFVSYQVVQVPTPAADEDYEASFTVSEL